MTHNEQDVERVATALQYRDDLSPNASYEDLARAALDALAEGDASRGLPSREQAYEALRDDGWEGHDRTLDHDDLFAIADCILALYPAAPVRTVTSVEELEALDWGARFTDADGVHWVAVQWGYIASDGGDRVRSAHSVPLPAIVLTPAPREASTVTAEVKRVKKAWSVEGPRPDIHRRAQARLRKEWPALANALDALRAAGINVQAGGE